MAAKLTKSRRLQQAGPLSAAEKRGSGRRGQGQWLRVPGCDGAGTAERSYPRSRSGAAAKRSYPAPEVRGGSQEELPCVRGQ